MDLYRFPLPDLKIQLQGGGTVTLPPDQAHHAQSVLRLNPGDSVILFDGQGAWVTAKLHKVAKSAVTASVQGAVIVDDPPAPLLTLATAVPKGDRAEWLIEQASQLNVTAVQWLDCDRGVVKPREGGGKIEKWRRLAMESAKQCGRTHLLQIHDLAPLPEVLERPAARLLWLDPGAGGRRVSEALSDLGSGSVLALIGPEGGWSDTERGLLETSVRAGTLQRVKLTSSVLRIETACAALAALVMAG